VQSLNDVKSLLALERERERGVLVYISAHKNTLSKASERKKRPAQNARLEGAVSATHQFEQRRF